MRTRGWKRKIRKLQNWKEESSHPALTFLFEYHFDYVKMFNDHSIHSFPFWYKREVVQALEDVAQAWTHVLSRHQDEFYLRLNVNQDDIFESQIIIAISNQIGQYKNRFIECEENNEKPLWLSKNEWAPFYSCSTWLEEELETLDADYRRLLLNNVIKIKEPSSPDETVAREYMIREGVIWSLEIEGTKKTIFDQPSAPAASPSFLPK
ncbi:hypothetical protein GKZ89_16130 [Bacillus mangrovi]|uniref:Uncharacterized protein n=1 Tax=Metabacillus mangrovi TaxID=1491830 RepID=A0A7X2V670_9BACI|nr:hypothetical protein [Metabacillus mangrovi]MTH54931.1 hypothetical protein [Metabacillus mangrovi]